MANTPSHLILRKNGIVNIIISIRNISSNGAFKSAKYAVDCKGARNSIKAKDRSFTISLTVANQSEIAKLGISNNPLT
jgi:hypothetical protein